MRKLDERSCMKGARNCEKLGDENKTSAARKSSSGFNAFHAESMRKYTAKPSGSILRAEVLSTAEKPHHKRRIIMHVSIKVSMNFIKLKNGFFFDFFVDFSFASINYFPDNLVLYIAAQ